MPYDVFLSYAWVDDLHDSDMDKGWVSSLVTRLERRLAQRLGQGSRFDLWHDKRQGSGNTRIAEALHAAVIDSSTLLVILSQGYLESDWCTGERRGFLHAKGDRLDDVSSLLFVVKRDKRGEDRCPPEFSAIPGYRFWYTDTDGETTRTRTMGDPTPDATPVKARSAYFRLLDALSEDLAEAIEKLRPSSHQEATSPGMAADRAGEARQPVVYLAEVTGDLDLRRVEVRQYLKQSGLRVLPGPSRAEEGLGLREALERDIRAADLFVQLLSDEPDTGRPVAPEDLVRWQYELARRLGKPILQWRDGRLRPDRVMDPDRRALLEGATVDAEGIEEFKARAVRTATPPPEPQPGPNDDDRRVLIAADRSDQDLARQVVEALARDDIPTTLPPWGRPSREYRAQLFRDIETCDAILVALQNAPQPWIGAQFADIVRVEARRPTPPAKMVIDARPPGHGGGIGPVPPGVRIVECRSGFDRELIRREFARLRGEARP